MTNGSRCACEWDGDTVTAFCGAHHAHHRVLSEPLIREVAVLEHIRVYSKTEHPIISSRACPLCDWDSEVKDGMWVGKKRKPCTYHLALNQLYALKIEGEEDIWDMKENEN